MDDMNQDRKPLNLRELIDEVHYSWQLCSLELFRHPLRQADAVHIHKLTITPTQARYKTETWELAPGVWERFNAYLDYMEKELEPLPTSSPSA